MSYMPSKESVVHGTETILHTAKEAVVHGVQQFTHHAPAAGEKVETVTLEYAQQSEELERIRRFNNREEERARKQNARIWSEAFKAEVVSLISKSFCCLLLLHETLTLSM
jgi:hypothetical protein